MIVTYHYSKKKSGFTLGSRLIMWAEGKDFSHCATEIQLDPDKESEVYEAVYPRSRKIPKSEWLTHSEPVHSIPFLITDKTVSDEIIFVLETNLKAGYSIMQLFVIFVGLIFKLIARLVLGIAMNANAYLICSEYQAKALRVQGAKFKGPEDSIDIIDCYEAALKLKGIE